MNTPQSQLTPRQRAELLRLAKSRNLKPRTGQLSPIITSEHRDEAALSFAQQRLWFLTRIEGGSEAYHMPMGWRLSGELDRLALKRALDRIVWRHEDLRTTFHQVAEQPVQRFAASDSGFALQEHDLSGVQNSAIELEQRMREEAVHRFDLERGPLVRGQLLRLREKEHVLLITMHHIVSDGWSNGVFTRELSALYSAYRRGNEDPLPPLTVQYADYAEWQRQRLTGEVLEREAEYWRRTLTGAAGLLELPTDRPRPPQQTYSGDAVPVQFSPEFTQALRALSRSHGMTPYMLALAAWTAVLSRLTGQEDVVIGAVAANRLRPEVEGLIGFFVNTQALRVEVNGTLADLLDMAKARTLEAQEHQELPFDQVVEILKPPRSLAYTPIFQVMITWTGNEGGGLEFPGLKTAPAQLAYEACKFDLELGLGEVEGRIEGELRYATALFDRTTIERQAGYLRLVLEAMVVSEGEAVACIHLLSDGERRQLLVEWNETGLEYPKNLCIHQLFEMQAAREPQAIAVSDEHQQLNYGELNSRANQLARYLQWVGVGPDKLAAIWLERGADMLVAVLGVLKAGGAYVPMDPATPHQRLKDILEDAQPRVLLTQRQLQSALPQCGATIVSLDQDWHLISTQPSANLAPETFGLTPSNLAYVIFTSGSTGRPKGVMIEHESVVNLLFSVRARPGITCSDRLLAVTTISFDIASTEMLLPLLVGAEIIVAGRDSATDGRLLAQLVKQRNATMLQGTPTTWRLLLEDEEWHAPGLTAWCAGETLSTSLAGELLSRVHALWNLYGPTETTIYSTIHPVTRSSVNPAANEPIGRPVANTKIYILDSHGEPAPIGATGEIYIAGTGVARGYLGKPSLTLERFIPDPFASVPGSRMYRTGDLGRWRADGNIEYVGRNDFQIKLRGFRIELGEIETRLAEHPSVRRAVVMAREDHAGEKRLVAYVAPAEAPEDGVAGTAIDVEALRAHLTSLLPEYMLPAAYVSLPKFPLTSSGKLDRKALPAPDGDAYLTREYEPPAGEVETTVARIWAEVLKLERIGRHDNFFGAGGHSLLAVRATSLLQQSGMEARVADLFNHPTVESFAACLLSTSAGLARRGVHIIREGRQKPLFLAHEAFGDDSYFSALAQYLPKDLAVYALPSMPPGEQRLNTMQAMAERMIDLLQQVQAEGPYRLAGWSFGGVLAYEIGQQLLAQGHTVEFLGLIDAFCPHANGIAAHPEKSPEAMLVELCEEQRGRNPDGQSTADTPAPNLTFNELLNHYRSSRALPENFEHLTAEEVYRQCRNVELHSRMMAAYRPRPIGVPIHLFVASQRPSGQPIPSESLGWERCVPAQLLYRQSIPGSHRSMMRPPYIKTLGQRLSESLAAVPPVTVD